MLETLRSHRAEVLWWEICCLLHDIGKLSDEFLWYRQNWHWMPEGYTQRDPHDSTDANGQGWLDRDGLLKEGRFLALREFFRKPILTGVRFTGTISVENAVHQHTTVTEEDEYIVFLGRGDRTDSIYDRNNPLVGCEQTDHARAMEHPEELPEMFRSNVFGYEGPLSRVQRGTFELGDQEAGPKHVREGVLHRARQQLYVELWEKLSPYASGFRKPQELCSYDYRAIRELLRKFFEPAMADTMRPNNDTSLWEHVYSVASLTKAEHLRKLLGGPEPGKIAAFRIWGFGYDALRYLSYSHRIGDLLGRREVLTRIFEDARRILEFEIPFGNCVYQDDNFILFLVPAVEGFDQELEKLILPISLERSAGEIVPQFTCSGRVEGSLTRMVAEIQKLRDATGNPVGRGADLLSEKFRNNWQDKWASVCAVCRMRPAHKEEENKVVCRTCLDRRRGKTTGFSLQGTQFQTPMVEEIADQHGRVALIVAKFGLREWLDGRMVRTTLITEPESIRSTITALDDLVDLEGNRQEWFKKRGENNYDQMLGEVRACKSGGPYDPLFLYARDFDFSAKPKLKLNEDPNYVGGWTNLLQGVRLHEHRFLENADADESLVNLLCAKTPTPSTILDVWETTREFLEGITGRRRRFGQEPAEDPIVEHPSLLAVHEDELHLKAKDRAYVEVAAPPGDLNKNQSLVARAPGGSCEAVYEGQGNRFWIVGRGLRYAEEWRGQRLELFNDDGSPLAVCEILTGGNKEAAYVPYRSISTSPDLLLLLVPADRAIEVTSKIYSQYREEFGKVWGRLPLSVATIFFPKHLPMFSVLDAARRAEGNFRRLHEGAWLQMRMPLEENELNLRLGTGSPDPHHPYIRSADKAVYDFKTLIGPVMRIDRSRGKEVLVRANYFDWEFLGASSDRFRLYLSFDSDTEDDPQKQKIMSRQQLPHRTSDEACGPVLMEELEERITGFWRKLVLSGRVTDTSIRNLEQALLSRRSSWLVSKPVEGSEAFQALAAMLIPEHFPRDLIEEAVAAVWDGYFFKTLNIYLRILKRRLEKGTLDDGYGRESQAIPPASVSR